jgi:malonyl-CoA/methylmalonyl-CoA synthetase
MDRRNSNFARALADAAATRPDRPCLVLDDDRCVRYGELDALAGRMASVLARHGVGAGDRVVAQAGKSPAMVALYLGCLRLGAVYVPLNGAYTAAEVGYFSRTPNRRYSSVTPAAPENSPLGPRGC